MIDRSDFQDQLPKNLVSEGHNNIEQGNSISKLNALLDTRKYLSSGPKADHTLTIEPDLSEGALQYSNTEVGPG
jgi:hypothetical protein